MAKPKIIREKPKLEEEEDGAEGEEKMREKKALQECVFCAYFI